MYSEALSDVCTETNMRDWLDAVEIPMEEVEMEGDNIR
jgi:hypothetical protein